MRGDLHVAALGDMRWAISCRYVPCSAAFAVFGAGLPFEEALEVIRALSPDWRGCGDPDHTYSLVFTRVFVPRSASDLLGVLAKFAPDVVHELSEFGAPIAAARCRIPWATHGLGLDRSWIGCR